MRRSDTQRRVVELTPDQRCYLHAVAQHGRHSPQTIVRATILLALDKSPHNPRSYVHDADVAAALRVSESTVWRVRRLFNTIGLVAAVFRGRRPRAAFDCM